jgi:dCTP deaminase
MTCRETVEHLQQITGLGNITAREPSKPGPSPIYTWNVTTARHVQMLLTRILPYMITKRARAVRVINLDLGASGQTVVDPKNFDPTSFVDIEGDSCLIPANSFALAETVEWLEIPRDVIALAVGKSTYARCGVVVNVTPLEPEWRGRVTIEISNTTPLPAKIYAGEGIAQILFLRAEAPCRVSYADKQGKYQDQKGLTLPFVLGSNRHK